MPAPVMSVKQGYCKMTDGRRFRYLEWYPVDRSSVAFESASHLVLSSALNPLNMTGGQLLGS